MKTKRHSKIIEFIKERDIETQDELANLLRESGFDVTQATISRDIRELKLIKVVCDDGKQKYGLSKSQKDDKNISEKLIKVFRDSVVNIDYAQNIIVLKTIPGMAMAVATAIDGMKNLEIIGNIAGDDNVFCIVKTQEKAISLIEKFKSIINFL